MDELLKKAEAETKHLEKEATQLGEAAVQNKMKIVGVIASCLSICMYVRLLGICPVTRETGSNRLLRSSTVPCGWATGFSASSLTGRS